ncbi:MAG TPA: DUF1501 domain-containing protein [Candidatus Obscuribacterales bacterium]
MKSRRAFLAQLALASEDALTSLDAGVLVCVFLRGGADTLNMFIPYGDDNYYKVRPSIAIAEPAKNRGTSTQSLRLNDFYALHPKLAPVYPLFADGQMAIVQAVGSDNESGSHFDAQDQMEHGEGYGKPLNGGWLARYLRARADKKVTPLSAIAIGATVPESLRSAPSVTALTSIDDVQMQLPPRDAEAVSAALTSLYSQRMDLLGQAGKDTLEVLKRLEGLRRHDGKNKPSAGYPDTEFGKGLSQIARLTKADVGLQIACINSDGWDTHFVQGSTSGIQADRMDELARGLAAFDKDLGPCRGRVTTIVMTEFGRRIYENVSGGTDHGRGFAMMVIGKGIKGGRIYGQWPGLADQGDFLLGPSGLAITYDYRSVLAEICSRNVPFDRIAQVFPQFDPQTIGFTG